MHLDTWKQLDMLGVNHLCRVQGNEESKKLIFPFVDEGHFFVYLCQLFCVFMVIGLTMEQCPILA